MAGKKPARLPFMPLLVDDWLMSPTTLAMKPIERAVYINLLAFQWREGSLPADQETLTRMAGVSEPEFSQAAPAVLKNFALREGRYRNRKLALLRKSAVSRISSFSLRGYKGGSAKSHRMNEICTTARQRASVSVSVSGSSLGFEKLENQEKPPTRARDKNSAAQPAKNGYDPAPGFAWFAGLEDQPAAYPSIRDMDAACRAWMSVVESHETEALIREALAPEGLWRRSQQWARDVYDDGANWLLRKLWRGKPARQLTELEKIDRL